MSEVDELAAELDKAQQVMRAVTQTFEALNHFEVWLNSWIETLESLTTPTGLALAKEVRKQYLAARYGSQS